MIHHNGRMVKTIRKRLEIHPKHPKQLRKQENVWISSNIPNKHHYELTKEKQGKFSKNHVFQNVRGSFSATRGS